MLCSSCQTELDPVMVVCPGCGVPVKDMNKASEHLDWRQQVHETVERHKAKRRRERARIDDEARQLSIFPEDSDEDEGEQLARKRRAEIRARVEEKLARRQTPAPESPVSDAGEVSIPSEEDSFGAANPGLELERGLGETRLDTTTAEFVESRSDARFRDHNAALELNESPLADEPLLSRPEQSGDLGGTPLMGLATAAERVLGGFIDVGFVSLIQLTLFYLTTHLVAQRIGALPATAIAAMSLVGAVLGAGYFLFFWSLSGQTLGKLLTGTRVVDLRDRPLGFSRALARILGAVAALLPLGAGFIGIWSDAERRGWHDRIAGSKVVRG